MVAPEPEIGLYEEQDGSLTLTARTLTPNSCYNAGVISVGYPPGYTGLPEQIALVAELSYKNCDVCQMYVNPVEHQLAKVPATEGHRELLVFIVLDGKILGANSVPLGDDFIIAGRYRTRGPGSGITRTQLKWPNTPLLCSPMSHICNPDKLR